MAEPTTQVVTSSVQRTDQRINQGADGPAALSPTAVVEKEMGSQNRVLNHTVKEVHPANVFADVPVETKTSAEIPKIAEAMPTAPAAPVKRLEQSADIPPWLDEEEPPQEELVRGRENGQQKPRQGDTSGDQALNGAKGSTLTPLGPATAATDRWFDTVMALEERGLLLALTRELAMNSQAQEMGQASGKPWVLFCERQILLQENNQRKLAQVLTDFMGEPVSLTFELQATNDTPGLRMKHMEEQKLAQAVSHVQADPDVQYLLQTFPGARIIPGSVKAL